MFSFPFCLFLVQLDDWVLCKIYKKSKKPKGVRNRQRDEENSTLTAMDNVDYVSNHDEDRTDLPVMDAGYVGEMDNVGADAVFTDDHSQQQIASSLQVNSLLILTSMLLHIAACFPAWPRHVEILPQYFPILTTCQPGMIF